MGISRREALLAPLVAAGCGRRKGTGYPGFAFVANQAGRSLGAVDLSTFSLARQIALEAAPSQVLAVRKLARAYALAPQSGLIFEVDTRSLTVARTARLGSPATGLRLARDEQALWALCPEARQLVEIPLERFRPGRRTRLPGLAGGFDLGERGMAAVSFPETGRVGLVEAGAPALGTTVPVGSDPGPLLFRSDGRQLLASDRAGRSLTVLDVAQVRTVVRLPLPLEPARYCVGGGGGQLFISGPGMDAVVIVYPYTTEVAETILAGKSPAAMGATETPPYLFVANPPDNSVTVLDIDTRRLVAVVGVGMEPAEIVFTPDGQYALILNRRSGDLAVVRIPTLGKDAGGRSRRYRPAPLFNLIPVGQGPVSVAVI